MVVMIRKENFMLVIKNIITGVLLEWRYTDTQMETREEESACLTLYFHLMYEGKRKEI